MLLITVEKRRASGHYLGSLREIGPKEEEGKREKKVDHTISKDRKGLSNRSKRHPSDGGGEGCLRGKKETGGGVVKREKGEKLVSV